MDIAYPLDDGPGGSTSLGAGLGGCISPRVSIHLPNAQFASSSHIDRFQISVDIGLPGIASSPVPRIDGIGGKEYAPFLVSLGAMAVDSRRSSLSLVVSFRCFETRNSSISSTFLLFVNFLA